MATLANSLARASPTAIVIPRKQQPLHISAERLHSEVSSLQHKLAEIGTSAELAVSISLPNSYEFIVAFLATTWQRAIAAPLNPAYKQDEFEFFINDLTSVLVLVPRGSFEKNAPAVQAARKHKAAIAEIWFENEVVLDVKDLGKLSGKGQLPVETAKPGDTALILHTSGTTGRPKAVPLTHKNLTKTMHNITDTYQLSPADRSLLVMPLFHVHGLLAGLLASLFSGGSVIVPPRFSASEFWQDFIVCGATWYTAVPTIHQILLRHPSPDPQPNIRFIRSCSSPLSPKAFHELESKFKAPVLEAYAMTEGAHQIASNPLPPAKRMPGCVGSGQGVEIRILDAGGKEVAQGAEAEIGIRGDNVTKGYINNLDANRASFTDEGFFRTGDQGTKDADGYVIITGRIKELITKGGEKISPVEIDNVVAQNPAVSEAVSFAISDEMYGQDIGLAIVTEDGGQLSEKDLRDWMESRVAKFKMPKKIFFTDVMPKTPTGKVQRRQVADTMLKQDRPKARL